MSKSFGFLLTATTLFAEVPTEQFSEALGHLIGQQLQSLDIPLDLNAIVKGIQDEKKGVDSPLTEEECAMALNLLIEQNFAIKKKRNLQEAEVFLRENRAKENIISLEEGKIQFEVQKKGSGDPVQHYNSPLVRYHGHFLNGDLLSSEPMEERLCLEEILPGLSKGIVGMREGEVRTLYIHPELSYSTRETAHPNSLIIFEVEILKADIPLQQEDILISPPHLDDVDSVSIQ